MGCGSSKATPIVPTPQRLLLPLPDGDAPESVVSRSVSVGKQLSLVDGKYARCELTLDNTTTKLVGTLKPEPNERLERRPSDDGAYTTEQILANLPVLPTKAGARLLEAPTLRARRLCRSHRPLPARHRHRRRV